MKMITELYKEIDETRKQMNETSSSKRKYQLFRHIIKLRKRIRRINDGK